MALLFILERRLLIVNRKVRGVGARALGQFAARAQRAVGIGGEVDVLITSSAQMRRLNRRFRGKNAATDVLSFLSDCQIHHGDTEPRRVAQGSSSVSLRLRGGGRTGDIAISAEMASRHARRLGHSAADEMKILILHGLLHLAGYDHETDAGAMARKEARLRHVLGLPAALIERAAAHGTRTDSGKRRRS